MLTMVVIGLLAVPALASAGTVPPYPAPPVDPAAAQYVSTADSTVTTASLASTGAGFSVGTAVVIGLVVVLVGLALAFAGNRVRKSTI